MLEKDSKNGIQSLEIGMRVLRVLVNGQRAMMLRDIALRADMPPAKAHRYLVSLIRAGLVTQDPSTSRYDLGPFALHMGLAAVNRVDRIRLGLQAIAELRSTINETTALAVWGNTGPVIVRWERPHRPITVNVTTGVSLNLLNTASGQVFAAWLPERIVQPLIAHELQTLQPAPFKNHAEVQLMLERVRQNGATMVRDNYMARGVEAIAAPVFNFRNEISMALVVVGIAGMSTLDESSSAMQALKTAASALSQKLGCTRHWPDADMQAPADAAQEPSLADAHG